MVLLYGADHSHTSLKLHEWDAGVYRAVPTSGLLSSLEKLPPKTRVGIELVDDRVSRAVKADLNALLIELERDLTSQRSYTLIGEAEDYYMDAAARYFEDIAKHCAKCGHEIVLLEDIDPYLKFNEALVKLNRQRVLDDENIRYQSKLASNIKKIKSSDTSYRLILEADKFNVLERDATLLKNIIGKKVDVAVVGRGHSDYWYSNRERLREDLGIVFDSYHADVEIGNDHRLQFFENRTLDSNILSDITNLERAVTFLENDRLVLAKEPDFVGTWDVSTPSKGYFELFIEEQDGQNVSGTIVDCVGDATFEGTLTSKSFDFVKTYQQAVKSSQKNQISFPGIKSGSIIHGCYNSKGLSSDHPAHGFVMVQTPQEDLIKLVMRRHLARQTLNV
ncbi:hypothetical protein GOV04_00710 [Candidatus Woesearchaeota archaeon]|nr:hypothetical protein [Candidatus Woesearchaeota archaeon]